MNLGPLHVSWVFERNGQPVIGTESSGSYQLSSNQGAHVYKVDRLQARTRIQHRGGGQSLVLDHVNRQGRQRSSRTWRANLAKDSHHQDRRVLGAAYKGKW